MEFDGSFELVLLHFRNITFTPPFRTHRLDEANEEVAWPSLKYA